MLRLDVLGEFEMSSTRCGGSIWDQDEYWCIQLIKSLDQACHQGFVQGKSTSVWTVALQCPTCMFTDASMQAQAILSICKSFPSLLSICFFFARLVNPSAWLLVPLLPPLFHSLSFHQVTSLKLNAHLLTFLTKIPSPPQTTICFSLWSRILVWYLMAKRILVWAR